MRSELHAATVTEPGRPGSTYSDGPAWHAFGLSRAAYHVVPRRTLQSMPVEWQARFVALGHQHVAHALLVETVQPGQGGVALQVGKRQAAPGLGDPGLALVASGAGLELVLARELLHHADGAHGHEVARRAESIGAVDGQVVDAELEGGVGPLAGGDRHVPCGRCRRILGDKRTRTGLRQAQRLVQRQGVGGMGGTGAHGERRSDADGEPAPWHGAARRAGGKRVDEHEISS